MNRIDDEQFQRLESLLRTFQLRARNKYEEARIATEIAKELEGVCFEIDRELDFARQRIEKENQEAWEATIKAHQQNGEESSAEPI
jgi:hypothetical protein